MTDQIPVGELGRRRTAPGPFHLHKGRVDSHCPRGRKVWPSCNKKRKEKEKGKRKRKKKKEKKKEKKRKRKSASERREKMSCHYPRTELGVATIEVHKAMFP